MQQARPTPSARLRRAGGVVTLLVGLAAPAAHAQSAADARPIPADTALRQGVLPNGLRYYVRHNGEPEKRAELRLVVDAGSVLEDEDQRGLAHFLEHMAFNGTTNFEKDQIVRYLESVGMRFGGDLNASTGHDETIYMLTVPTDTLRVVLTALDILEDWTHRITLDSAEIVAERGVVLEEWRARRGAGARMRERIDSVLYGGSRYADRDPIGTTERIESARRDELLRFYRDWYRPDLMAVVVVGDVDVATVEAAIRERFSGMPPARGARPRPAVRLADEPRTRVAIVTDEEATGTGVQVLYKLPRRHAAGTVGEYRASLEARLFHAMLGQRLSEIARRPEAPFLGAGSESGTLVREAPVLSLSVAAKENASEAALAALLVEVERVVQHGFTPAELERAKLDVLRGMESRVAARDAIGSASYAARYVDHFLTGSPIAGVEGELALLRELLPAIDPDGVRAVGRIWRSAANRIVLATMPEKEGVVVPTERSLFAVFDSVATLHPTPYAEALAETPLVAQPPVPGRVVAERPVAGAGVVEWTLSNGARVLFKQTDFNADQVAIRAVSPGGLSLVPDASLREASLATGMLAVGGLGDLPIDALRKRLAGKVVSVGAAIGGVSEEISASGSPRDLETMLQLMYLQFTAPRVDSAAVAAYRASLREQLANRASSPAAVFQDTITAVLTQGHPRARPLTPAAVDSVDVLRSLRFYRDRFADAGDFTFVVVGAFDADSLRPLVERWIGSLPGTSRAERPRDTGIRAPSGVVRRTVHAGTEPKSETRLYFTGAATVTPESQHLLDALGRLLERRLTERLREKLGGTYSPSVRAGMASRPIPRYEVSIAYGSSPERAAELAGQVVAALQELQAGGPTAQELHDIAEAQRRMREGGLRQNGYWLGMLSAYVQEGWDLASIAAAEPPGGGSALTAEGITAAARRYLDIRNYVQVTLLPAAGAP